MRRAAVRAARGRAVRRVALVAGGAAVALAAGNEAGVPACRTVVRTTRAVATLSLIAADYKYTMWRHPRPPEAAAAAAEEEEGGQQPQKQQQQQEQRSPDENQRMADDRAEALERAHERSSARLLSLFQRCGGLYIKVGQYLSSLGHILPAVYTETMRPLQDAAPTMEWEEARQVLREELGGRDPDEVFSRFERRPIAAASLAQVHDATLRETGERVAVKVQHRQLLADFDGDMFVHWFALTAASWMFDDVDLVWMHNELEPSLRRELDFANEGRNAERCASDASALPRIHVPRVHWPLTGRRVLTMEFIEGVRVTDLDGLRRIGASPAEVTRELLDVISRQIFLTGHVHADTHAGNFLVRRAPAGSGQRWQLAVLDHGLYREVSDRTRVSYCRLWKALVQRDEARVLEAVRALGVDERHWELLALAVLMRPYSFGGALGYAGGVTPEARRRLHRRLAGRTGTEFLSVLEQLPREVLLLLRTQNYLRAINRDMGVPVNRFHLMARLAARGAAEQRPTLSRWKDRITFEFGLLLQEVVAWAAMTYMRWFV